MATKWNNTGLFRSGLPLIAIPSQNQKDCPQFTTFTNPARSRIRAAKDLPHPIKNTCTNLSWYRTDETLTVPGTERTRYLSFLVQNVSLSWAAGYWVRSPSSALVYLGSPIWWTRAKLDELGFVCAPKLTIVNRKSSTSSWEWSGELEWGRTWPPQSWREAIAKVNSMNLQGNSHQKSIPTTSHIVNGFNCQTQLLIGKNRVGHLASPARLDHAVQRGHVVFDLLCGGGRCRVNSCHQKPEHTGKVDMNM